MATFVAFVSASSCLPSRPPPRNLSSFHPHHNYSPFSISFRLNPRKYRTLIFASSSDDHFVSNQNSNSSDKKSVLSDLIQEIEPLDVSLIQRDVPPTTLDAMKRTISGMLGLLPSDQFKVSIDALWEPLSKLLVSSLMTGYTLRNAEYRLCLERNIDEHDELFEKEAHETSKIDLQGTEEDSAKTNKCYDKSSKSENSRLSSVKKELHDVKRKSAALQMQQFVGEEKNDLLDYLRSLQPEKVAELSEPTSSELKEVIYSVVHGLLATLSPKMHSKAPPQSENTSTGARNVGCEDCTELVENTSLPFQPLISLTRDYLARLLFWCMLLGHYLRGLEYRMELMELLSLTGDAENDACGDEQVA
ncbi:hypothetical protein M5689_000248 [Euphorbia peplus]|nr:hypothetical protein M5689_000248 [Euphorbia peplus]